MTYLFEKIHLRDKIESTISVLEGRINKWNVVPYRLTPGAVDGVIEKTFSRPYDMEIESGKMGKRMDEWIELSLEIEAAYSDIPFAVITHSKRRIILEREITKRYLLFLQGLNMKEDFYGQCNKGIDELKRDILISSTEERIFDIDAELSNFEHLKEV